MVLNIPGKPDGTIDSKEIAVLDAFTAWMQLNGEAIYDTVPWDHAVGKSSEGDDLRFTRKGDDLYVTILGSPKGKTVLIMELPLHGELKVTMLGEPSLLSASPVGSALKVTHPEKLKGEYAYVLKLASYFR